MLDKEPSAFLSHSGQCKIYNPKAPAVSDRQPSNELHSPLKERVVLIIFTGVTAHL